ncbi:hypothetical protein HMPREF1214_00220 [Bacteroides sp. HPS0048]|jgi:hypothetical protein|uniref:hypothetical protein n=1 Tax=Bacteroides sp. HPS0048 TaxID=1078089 RepID=UPI0003781236|nr:hypothetical protein [Bacteroides sp. HPS0048]EOA60514.1 hypothetical protein HMPREF1214_00220 [Bacteroides sp. HPS0048]
MDYNRLVIDTLKHALVVYASTNALPIDEINKAILNVEIGIDNAITEDKETNALIALKNDLEEVKRACYEKSN